MGNKTMKPSERIEQLIGPTRSDPEYYERKINAIVEYLNEQQPANGGKE